MRHFRKTRLAGVALLHANRQPDRKKDTTRFVVALRRRKMLRKMRNAYKLLDQKEVIFVGDRIQLSCLYSLGSGRKMVKNDWKHCRK
jgi:hypothetical protein